MTITTEQLKEIFVKVFYFCDNLDVINLSKEDKINLANNPNTSPKTLELLATDEVRVVRYWVTRNPNTSPKVLAQLATDEDSDIRWCVAQNPNTSPKVLEQLATDEDYWVRYWAASNSNCPHYVKNSFNIRNQLRTL